jgi:hypothetical protein
VQVEAAAAAVGAQLLISMAEQGFLVHLVLETAAVAEKILAPLDLVVLEEILEEQQQTHPRQLPVAVVPVVPVIMEIHQTIQVVVDMVV